MCLPREIFHTPRDAACGRKWLRAGQPPIIWKRSAEGTVAAGETSPAEAGRTHPGEGPNGPQPNGLGKWSWLSKSVFLLVLCSPAAGWRENAGSVAFPKARQTIYSFVSVLTSRIAGYVISMSGGAVPWEGRSAMGEPIPIAKILHSNGNI